MAITSIDGQDVGVNDFKNVWGTIEVNKVPTTFTLQNLAEGLYNLADGLIICNEKYNKNNQPPAPRGGKGLWLDTSE